jgi:hypothetical protein
MSIAAGRTTRRLLARGIDPVAVANGGKRTDEMVHLWRFVMGRRYVRAVDLVPPPRLVPSPDEAPYTKAKWRVFVGRVRVPRGKRCDRSAQIVSEARAACERQKAPRATG